MGTHVLESIDQTSVIEGQAQMTVAMLHRERGPFCRKRSILSIDKGWFKAENVTISALYLPFIGNPRQHSDHDHHEAS